MKTKLQPWLMALACLLMAGPALANTNTVTTLADPHEDGKISLREAIATAQAGDTINFQPFFTGLTGTITLTNELDIATNLNIVGPGATNLTIRGVPIGFPSPLCRVFNISAGATNTISGITISGGWATGSPAQGGGILNAGNLTLLNCIISGNTAQGDSGADDAGGGIFSSGPLTLLNCTISGNTASGGYALGGGIYSSNTLTLVNCLVTSNNLVGGAGGGIEAQGTLAMSNCTVSFNSINGGNFTFGGGIDINNNNYGTLVNCTIASNSITGATGANYGSGGGISVQVVVSVMLVSCTVSGNSAAGAGGEGGGIAINEYGETTLENTIVSGNSVDAGGFGPDVHGNLISGGHNFIGNADGANTVWINGDGHGTTGHEINPLLGPLQDNGGPTPTMAPALNSLVVDQGTNFGINTDQRGSPRPFVYQKIYFNINTYGDGSDIGAVELSVRPRLQIMLGHPIIITTPTTNVFPSSVRVVSWANDSPGPREQVKRPVFFLQTESLQDNNPVWLAFAGHVRLINNEWVARDTIAGQGLLYRTMTPTNSTMTNVFYPPDITLSASNILTTSATLNGSDIPSETNTVYWFEYGTDPNNYGGMTPPTPLDTSDNPSILTCSVGGLLPATLYHFQLVVTNDWSVDTGPELGGDQTFTTLGLPPVVVTTPAPQVSSNCPTCFSALLKGTVNPRGSPTFAWFYYYSDTAASGQTTPQSAGSGNIAIGVQQAVFNLTLGATYYFEIVASNSAGITYGQPYQTFTAMPSVPPVVVTTNATYVSCGGDCSPIPVLNGTVNGNGASFTGYFQYGLNTNNYSFDTSQYPFSGNNNSPQLFSFTMTNVTLNTATTYHYRIVAFNGTNEGVGGDKTFISP
jgi:hypothetical protein